MHKVEQVDLGAGLGHSLQRGVPTLRAGQGEDLAGALGQLAPGADAGKLATLQNVGSVR